VIPTRTRRVACAGLASAGFCLAVPAVAGSYLNRAALLIGQARDEANVLRKHVYDRELARVVRTLCEGRLEAGQEMLVPNEVRLAHPHLVLMLERYERAADSAVRGKPEGFLALQRQALDEEQIFRSVLKRLGWDLPQL